MTVLDVADPRSEAARQAAQDELASAIAAEATASAAVDEARELAALGRATKSEVILAQRRLAAAQEATETAKAVVRAVDRAAGELHAAERAERESRRVERARTLRLERDQLAAEAAAFFDRFLRELEDLDSRLADWSDRAAVVRSSSGYQPGSLSAPSVAGVPYGRLVDAIGVFRRIHYPSTGRA